ncbi:MAG: hypothetical protein ACREFP_21595 [Acetobacteraceae bacterium]
MIERSSPTSVRWALYEARWRLRSAGVPPGAIAAFTGEAIAAPDVERFLAVCGASMMHAVWRLFDAA